MKMIYLLLVIEIAQAISFAFRKYHVQWLEIFPLENKFNNHIGIDLHIGTPPSTLTLNVEFYSNSVWVFHPTCHDMSISMNINQQPFQYMRSSTYVHHTDTNMYTLKGRSYIKAFKGNDIILTTTNNNNNNLITTNVTLFICERLTDIAINSGIIGVNIQNENDTTNALAQSTKGFISQLKANNVIAHEMFYFKYINNTHGEFIIGEYPLHHNNYLYKHINQNKWEININQVIYDFGYTDYNAYTYYNVPIRFKIEYGFIIGPNSLYNMLKEKVLHEYINTKQCVYHDNIHYHYQTFICKKDIINESFYKKFPRLVFVFGNANNSEMIVINREELFEDINNEYKAFIIAFGDFDIGEGWVFGETVFKQHNIVFDIENASIGVLFNNKVDESIIIKKMIICIKITTLFIYTIYVIYIKQYVHIHI